MACFNAGKRETESDVDLSAPQAVQDLEVIRAEFARLVEAHDLTYTYADDSRAYARGRAEHDALIALAKQLPRETAAAIWNAAVDRKITPAYRADFYWPERLPTAGELVAEGEARSVAAPWLAYVYRIDRVEAERRVTAMAKHWGFA